MSTGSVFRLVPRAVSNAVLLATLLAAVCLTAQAEVTAIVDRDRVALGDTLRLIITSTEGESLGDIDFSALQRDFEILQRSSSSQTNIVNGSLSRTKQLQIDIAPRFEGKLVIPALEVEGEMTKPIAVTVSEQPQMEVGDQPILFEAEVDRNTVYVQGQLLLTLRVMQAINLEDRSVSQFELDNAFVKPLQQQSYQREIDGRPWLVHELRYAIFPEQSGTLEIPAQVFTAREAVPRRSLFDLGGGGRSLRRSSEPISIEVLPRPRQFPSTDWLPARNLSIEEQWSMPPEQLTVGASATRTLRLKGEGLQGAQLPPVTAQAVDGLKFYPDQPVIDEEEITTGLMGKRQDSTAIVPTQAGAITLPEVRIPWWDTESETVRYAVLPPREITIAPGEQIAPPIAAAPAALEDSGTAPPPPETGSLLWQLLAIISTLGWLLTLAYLWFSRQASSKNPSGKQHNPRERQAFKALRAACRENQAVAARKQLLEWARAYSENSAIVALAHVEDYFADAELSKHLAGLDNAIYGGADHGWEGASLEACINRLRRERRMEPADNEAALTLYQRS